MRQYKYSMGIKVNNTPIPDPSEWNYQVSDLDTEGGRDATGLLHRAYVATKVNYDFSWNALDWEMLQHICEVLHTPQFTLLAPDPVTFNTMRTGQYYCGDRSGKCYYYLVENEEKAQFDLKVNFIEY